MDSVAENNQQLARQLQFGQSKLQIEVTDSLGEAMKYQQGLCQTLLDSQNVSLLGQNRIETKQAQLTTVAIVSAEASVKALEAIE